MKTTLPFEGPYKNVDGHKFWKPDDYKGYIIQPYESPSGERVFLVGDPKSHTWLYDSKKLECCGAFIDMLVLNKSFEKRKSNGKRKSNVSAKD